MSEGSSTTVCPCGAESSEDARFCRDCGRALLESASDLLTLSPESVEQGPTKAEDGGNLRFWGPLLGAAAVVGLVWLVVSLLLGPGDSGTADDDVADDATAEESDEGADDDEGGEEGEEDDLGDSEDPVEVNNDGADVPQRTETSVSVVADTGGPALGEDVEYRLLMSTGSGGPSLLDLNTLELTSSAGIAAELVAVVGDLVLIQGRSQIQVLPVDNLGQEPVRLLEGFAQTSFFPQPRSGSGVVWVLAEGGSDGSGEIVLMDVARREPVDRLEHNLLDDNSLWSGTPYYGEVVLASPASGGVYELRDGEPQRMADGRLVEADDERALVQTCDDQLVCSYRWFDRPSWAPIELTQPPADFDIVEFRSGTDWLWTSRMESLQSGTLTNVVTGMAIEAVEVSGDGIFGSSRDTGPEISPDGRWLARKGDDPTTVELLNLLSGELVVIPVDELVDEKLFFVSGVGDE